MLTSDLMVKIVKDVDGTKEVGKYDVILRKSATVYCKNDITDEVIKFIVVRKDEE